MIESLTDDAQILLLYLADELPRPDRQLIEQRLINEPGLKAELDQLAAIQQHVDQSLARLDSLSELPVSERAVVRSIGMEMRKRVAMPCATAPPEESAWEWRFRPWMISAGVAACVVVSAAFWIEHTGGNDAPSPVVRIINPTTQADPQPDENLALFVGSFKSTDSELADAVNSANAKKDAVSQDDLSQYLLNVGSVQD